MLPIPSAIHIVGEVHAAIRAMIRALIPHANCLLTIAIIERIRDIGTKMIAKKKSPSMANTRAHIPTAELGAGLTITVVFSVLSFGKFSIIQSTTFFKLFM